MPDFDEVASGDCVLSLWCVDAQGKTGAQWHDGNLSGELRRDLHTWYRTYEEHCYFSGDQWQDKRIYDAWLEEGRRLWALANRELLPQGFLVERAFEGYPEPAPVELDQISFRSGRPNDLSLATSARITETIAATNSVLRQHGEATIEYTPHSP